MKRECSGCKGTGCWMCNEPTYEDMKVLWDNYTQPDNTDRMIKYLQEIKEIRGKIDKLKHIGNLKERWIEIQFRINDGYEAEIVDDFTVGYQDFKLIIEIMENRIKRIENKMRISATKY